MEESRFQNVADSKERFCRVEGFFQKVFRPEYQSFPLGCAGTVSRENQYREATWPGHPRLQLAKNFEAIRRRHVEIEKHEVRVELVDDRRYPAAIGCRSQCIAVLVFQNSSQEPKIRLLIIDYEYARAAYQSPDSFHGVSGRPGRVENFASLPRKRSRSERFCDERLPGSQKTLPHRCVLGIS